jgi:protein phosphatase
LAGERFCAASAATHVGLVRSNNEDMCAVAGWTSGKGRERWQGELAAEGGWALVADGMGGHAAGEVASELALSALAPMMDRIADAAAVAAALHLANARLYETMAAEPARLGMGTTIAGIALRGESVLAFNVGDSRIYRWSDDALVQVSTDHALGGGLLTQCLGGVADPAPLRPCAVSLGWEAGACFLLCSDGLTNMVTDEEIARLLANARERSVDVLIAAALAAGGADNVTAVLIEAPR